MGYHTYVKIYITYKNDDFYIKLKKLFENEVYGISINNYSFNNENIQYEDFTMTIPDSKIDKYVKYIKNEYGIQFDIKNLYFMIKSGYM